MSDIELRLRAALAARAELVQPEDLNLSPVLEPPEEPPGPWWQRPGAYLFVAAVLVILIGLPLLALAATNPDDNPDPGPAESPTGTSTMTDPAPMQVDSDLGDVDGDGTPDDVRVMATASSGATLADHAIEVELSTTGATAAYEIGRVSGALVAATVNVDGRRGEELIVALEPESVDLHRAAPIVVSLRDGELASILGDALAVGGDQSEDGLRTYWWVHDAELWWWRSAEPVAEDATGPFAVDVVRFPREFPLRGVDQGRFCVTATMQTQPQSCDAEPPTGSEGETGGSATRLTG